MRDTEEYLVQLTQRITDYFNENEVPTLHGLAVLSSILYSTSRGMGLSHEQILDIVISLFNELNEQEEESFKDL